MRRILLTLTIAIAATLYTKAQTSLQQSIRFVKDSMEIKESQISTLQMMAEYIKQHPDEIIIIGGFTSKETPATKIAEVCEKRAEAVKRRLVEDYDIDPERLVAIGAGVSTRYEEATFNEVVTFFKK